MVQVTRPSVAVIAVVALVAACSGSGQALDDAETVPAAPPDTGLQDSELPSTDVSVGARASASALPSQPEPTTEPEPTPDPLDPLQGLALEPVVEGLTDPVDVAALDDGRLFVVERTGTIVRVDGDDIAEEPFLDLRGTVHADSIEQGLLGMAFHPDYPADARVFLYHSLPNNDNVLVTYQASDDDANSLDPDSREVLLTVDKEPDKVRHNGGSVQFSPDGYLMLSVGDAARASVNGQDPSTLPGTILRIDVDTREPYAVPADNPFADGRGGAPEVWWFGLRNPWRFTIDEESGLAYIADVGQETVEEVNVVPFDKGGMNFGWPVFEGSDPFYGGEPSSDVTSPVFEVRRNDTDLACSITGGLVYRGAAIPELDGHYFYADWCHGWIRSLRYDGGEVTEQQDWTDQLGADMVAAFGVDTDGELLVIDYAGGTVARVVARR